MNNTFVSYACPVTQVTMEVASRYRYTAATRTWVKDDGENRSFATVCMRQQERYSMCVGGGCRNLAVGVGLPSGVVDAAQGTCVCLQL